MCLYDKYHVAWGHWIVCRFIRSVRERAVRENDSFVAVNTYQQL